MSRNLSYSSHAYSSHVKGNSSIKLDMLHHWGMVESEGITVSIRLDKPDWMKWTFTLRQDFQTESARLDLLSVSPNQP